MTANLSAIGRRGWREAGGRATMDRVRRALEADRAAAAHSSAPLPLPGPQASARSPGAVRHPLHPAHRHRLAASAAAAGLRLGHHLLAAPRRVAEGRRLGEAARPAARAPARRRADRLLAGGRRLQSRAGQKGGAQTGPSPVDRGRAGSKHHLLVDASGIPLACTLTGGNRNDVTQLLPLLDAVPALRGWVGAPRRRPDRLLAERGYDHDRYRRRLRARGITPLIGRRGSEHGSGRGRHRWVVERSIAWLHGFRRLLVRYERRADIHEAFLTLACCMICFRRLRASL